MAAANRIKVVLLDAGTITSDGLTRVAEFASEVIVVGERRRSDVVEQLQARGVKVTVEQGKADIESAILTAARSEAVVVITGRPGKAEVFVRNAAHGAANAVEQGLPAVGVYVLGEHETRPGKVFTVSETGELSGYEPLFAAALAEQLGREVVAVTPPGRIRAARTVSEHPSLGGADNVSERAHEIAELAGVKWTERSDPSPVNSVIEESGHAAVIIVGVLDVPSGPKWLGSRPKVDAGNPAAAVSLVADASCDVMVVFDGVHLTHEKLSKDQAAAILGLGLMTTGAAAAVATPASAMLGHVTKSITQQARTYRADIGDSDRGDASSSADAKDSDTKDSESKDADSGSRGASSSHRSSTGGATTHKAPKTTLSASTVHTSTHSGLSDAGAGTSGSSIPSTRSAHPVPAPAAAHGAHPAPAAMDLGDLPAPPPPPPPSHGSLSSQSGDGLRDGIGGHDAWGHSCDRGNAAHCDHPSHTETTTGTGTTTTQPPGGTQVTEPPTPHPTPTPKPHKVPHQVPTPTPTPTPQVTQQTPTPMPTPQQVPHQVPTPTPTPTPQVTQQTPTPQVPTGTPTTGGEFVPQPGNTEVPWTTLTAQTNTGAPTPEAGVVPGDPASGTPTSVVSAGHNVGEQPSHIGPAALGHEQGAPPEGELAHTGADGVGVLAGMAASLIAAGSGLVIAGRRKKDDEDEDPAAAD